MEEVSSHKFERRLTEETSKLWIAISELRAEMHAGFMGMQEQMAQVYKEIAKLYESQDRLHAAMTDIHESISSYARWTLTGMLGVGGFLLAVAKFF